MFYVKTTSAVTEALLAFVALVQSDMTSHCTNLKLCREGQTL
jgi:hypothetical protein